MTPATGAAPQRNPLEDVEWGSVLAQAAFVAKAYVRAEDLGEALNEGARRVLDGTAPWDPASGVELADHVAKVGIAAVRASARTLQRRTANAVETMVVDSMSPPPSSPEIRVARSQSAREIYGRLVGQFAGDTQALAILACIMGSITEPTDQAEHTGLDIELVHNIRKRVHRRIEAHYQGGAT